jgi:branched-chain amino acid transport system permease protein
VHPILPFVSTLALAILTEASISMIFGVNVLSLSTEMSDLIALPLDLSLTVMQGYFVAVSLMTLCALAFYLNKSLFGKQLLALAESPTYLASLGISIDNRRSVTFFLAVVLAFFAGIFLGFETNLQPMMGSSIMIKAFAAMVLGGMTSLGGAIFGAYLLAIIESLLIGLDFGVFSVPASYRDSVSLVFVMFVLLVRPQGLFAKRGRIA